MVTQSQSGWTSARERLLAKLVEEGCTAQQVAAELPGFSRSAIIGKAKRLKLKWRLADRPPRTQEEHNKRKRDRRQETRAAGGPPAIRIPGQPGAPRERPTIVLAPEMRQLTFMELELNQCRWPIDASARGSNLFCGAATQETYCPFHRMHSTLRGPKRDPIANAHKIRENRRLAAEAIRERVAR